MFECALMMLLFAVSTWAFYCEDGSQSGSPGYIGDSDDDNWCDATDGTPPGKPNYSGLCAVDVEYQNTGKTAGELCCIYGGGW